MKTPKPAPKKPSTKKKPRYIPDNFKEVFEGRDGGAEEYGVFEKESR